MFVEQVKVCVVSTRDGLYEAEGLGMLSALAVKRVVSY